MNLLNLISKEGYSKLVSELKILKETERPKVIELISSSRALGDLSENAEYHAAKARQREIESKISYLEKINQMAEVVDVSLIEGDVIKFGAKVVILNLGNNEKKKIRILSEYEATLDKNVVSVKSPIGKELIGKKTHDIVDIETPNGEISYEILSFSFRN